MRLRGILLLVIANILIPLGMLIYMTGLFRGRPKPAVTELSTLGQLRHHELLGTTGHNGPFEKVIFMIVDALRSDFVFAEDSGFAFTQSLIRSGAAVPITALSAMPTLTVSRIKALTQGSSQSFLDAWLNVANSPEAMRLDGEDTWLSRLKASRGGQKKIVFYGIEMWVDLYPDVFDRKEEFSSFHVPGLVNVDRNVTRHLSGELARDDWAALILHYLGLDCIAHMGGPRSALMRPKQLEMDAIVRDIYNSLASEPHMQDTLLVLLGDHGMTAQGNHGGRLPEELAAATVFISPKLHNMTKPQSESPLETAKNYQYYSTVNQIDIVPTLSGLLDFPIPSRNLGVFIPDMLPAFGDDVSAVEFLAENARQIHGALGSSRRGVRTDGASCDDNGCTRCSNDWSRAECFWEAISQAEKTWETSPADETRELLKISIYEFAAVAQGLLSVSEDNISLSRLLIGVGCISAAALLTFVSFSLPNSGSWSLLAVAAVYSSTMFVPKLVEEEHHYWYWGSLAWLIFLSFSRSHGSRIAPACLGLVALHFMGQCVSQNGTKYSIAEHIDDLIFAYPIILWIPTIISHAWALVSISKNLQTAAGWYISVLVSLALCAAAVIFKLSSTYTFNPELLSFLSQCARDLVDTVPEDRLLQAFWTGILGCFGFFVWQRRTPDATTSSTVAMMRVVELFNLYLRSQSRPKNLSLFIIFDYQLQVLLMMGLSPAETATTVLLLGQSGFYSMGRDNSIASLDLLNGFNGLGESNLVAVMTQTILSNWVGPVWWSFAGLRLLASWAEARQRHVEKTRQNGRDSSSHVSNGHAINYHTANGESETVKSPRETAATPNAAGIKAGTGTYYFEYLILQTMFSALSSLALTLACIYIWGHEDLWNIYAPKFINASLWAFFHQFLVNGLGCTIIWVLVGN